MIITRNLFAFGSQYIYIRYISVSSKETAVYNSMNVEDNYCVYKGKDAFLQLPTTPTRPGYKARVVIATIHYLLHNYGVIDIISQKLISLFGTVASFTRPFFFSSSLQ